MANRLCIGIIMMVIAVLCVPVSRSEDIIGDVGTELRNLDEILKKRRDYINDRKQKIDSLRSIRYSMAPDSIGYLYAIERIGDAYIAFNNDSTLYYFNFGLQQARKLGNDSMATVFRIKGATYLPLSGFVNEAVTLLNDLDTAAMSPKLYLLYIENARQMYSYIASFYKRSPDVKEYYQARSLEYQKKILDNDDYDSDIHNLNYGEYLYSTQRYSEANAVLTDLISRLSPESNLYARACHIISSIAAADGNSEKRIVYLARSAASDVKGATLEVVSLQELGNYLYNHGDVERSYVYLQNALENAVECNAAMRMIEVSSAIPIIEQAHSKSVSDQKRKLTIMLVVMGIMLLVIAVILIYINRERNRVSVLKLNLEQANRTKDVYLGQFMNLCSTYMEKLISFNKVVNRKLSTGKTEDLYKITKSGKFIEEQAQEFYQAFDDAFLHIYPDFVRDVNKLLLPEEQIVLEDGEKMNTNLRILAFIRLGMNDASQIAQIMNYSVNTVYAYRNRLRNKAKNRDTFEQDIMNILGI